MEPFIGEIKLISWGWVPSGWAYCDGQPLQVSQNQALYAIIGNTYGGNTQTFNLPDLRGRVPLHPPAGSVPGPQGGESSHVLTAGEMPAHTHQVRACSGVASQPSPANNAWATLLNNGYSTTSGGTMGASAISTVGGEAHNTCQPSLGLYFIIALQGIFPTPD